MTDRFFPYRIDRRFKALLLPLGVRDGHDGVTLTEDGQFRASFGWLGISTSLDNISDAHITSDYRWYKVIGARLSLADDGLTYGTNAEAGVCVHFDEPVHSIVGFRDHPAVTVTVADCDGLVAALSGGGPGTSRR